MLTVDEHFLLFGTAGPLPAAGPSTATAPFLCQPGLPELWLFLKASAV